MNWRRACCAAGLLLVAGTAPAGDWDLQPRLSTSLTWTDNVALDPPGEEESDFITSVTPGLSLRGQGARLRADIDYRMQMVFFAGDSDRNKTNHQLQGLASAELLPEHLFVDASALMFQALSDSRGASSSSNLNFIDNRTNVISYGVSPYWLQSFGSLASLRAGYDYTGFVRSDSSNSDQVEQGYSASLVSGRDFSRTPWGLLYARRVNESDRANQDSTFESLTGQLGYVVNRRIRLNGSVGIEQNDFQTSRERDDGMTWSAGATLTPNPRTSIGGSYGERAFGETWSLNVQHRLKRWLFGLQYSEDFQTQARLFRQQLTLGDLLRSVAVRRGVDPGVVDELADEDLQAVLDDLQIQATEDDLLDQTVAERSLNFDQVYLSRAWGASALYTLKRDTFTFRASRQEREAEIVQFNSTEIEQALGGNWTHTFNARLRGGLRASWQESEFVQEGRTDTLLYLTPFVRYQLGPDLSVNLRYSHARRDSDAAGADYRENAVTALFNYAF